MSSSFENAFISKRLSFDNVNFESKKPKTKTIVVVDSKFQIRKAIRLWIFGNNLSLENLWKIFRGIGLQYKSPINLTKSRNDNKKTLKMIESEASFEITIDSDTKQNQSKETGKYFNQFKLEYIVKISESKIF